jgi:chorismate dehydratase
LLERGEVDVALVPLIEYQRLPNLRVIPGICVGSRRRVRSVVLASKKADLREVASVALDESSRTSATLIKILFKEFLRVEPQWTSTTPPLSEMLLGNDAALIIGDPAMTYPHEGLEVFDLATLWEQQTGFGFVFAMWMTQADFVPRLAGIDFAEVRDYGLEQIDEIVDEYQKVMPLSREELTQYLTENISYSIDPEMRAGLDLYFNLARKHNLIPLLTPLAFAGK